MFGSVTLVDYKSFSERDLVQRSTEYYIVLLSHQLSNRDGKTNISLDLSIDIKYTKSNQGLCHHFQSFDSSSQDISTYLKINYITNENKKIIFVQLSENLTHRISSINILDQNSDVKHLKIFHILRPPHPFFNDKISEVLESIAKQIVLKKLDSSIKVHLLRAINSHQVPKDVEVIFTSFGESLFFQKDSAQLDLPYQFEVFSDPTQDSSDTDFAALFQPFEKLTIHDKPSSPDKKGNKLDLNSEKENERKSELTTNQSSLNSLSPGKEEPSSMQSLDLMNQSSVEGCNSSEKQTHLPPKTAEKECQTEGLETTTKTTEAVNKNTDYLKDDCKAENASDILSEDQDYRELFKYKANQDANTEKLNQEDAAADGNVLKKNSDEEKQEQKEKPIEEKVNQEMKSEDILLVEQQEFMRKQNLFSQIQIIPCIEPHFCPVGLPRNKNLCYLNSGLQCLLNTPLFTLFFIYGARLNIYKNQDSLPYTFGYILQVIQSSYQNPCYHNNWHYRQQIPYLMHSLRMYIGQRNPIFKGFEQQDAFEFLMTFLECISHDLNRANAQSSYKQIDAKLGSHNLQYKSFQYYQNMLAKENSIVTDLFCGQLATKLTCCDCQKEKTTFEPYWALSIALKNDYYSYLTLEQLLVNFFKEEKCADSSPICGVCKKDNITILAKTMIWRLPEILIITLKRSQQFMGGYEKNNTAFRYPLQLDLTQYCKESEDISVKDPHYTLFGVINHTGTLKAGHYTADCVNLYNKRWYHFDDEDVTTSTINWNKKEDQGSPYILFYVRSSQYRNHP